ncbi:endonuclease/exonuclease/phosphatase family protein [Geopsychrobacter electrodiphilus]|uniref:endonuclease/exonuclease/phosphatase family protein n=1 Tax=Geopsychrobacter electrodiphilus TaxID=225196 RepID=UPI0003662DDF|nr:endonuclease/exonuclease/phosphatase family protein [Geopsychrobacter electrodiphilus]
MRFLLYNIRYATGPRLHKSASSSKKNLERITVFLRDLEPDLVGLIEVDHGSYRSSGENQAELLAKSLGHYHSHSIKYEEDSLWRHVPVIRNQGNAFLTRYRIRGETFHFFKSGMKRLVIELELQHVVVYLVHLALGARTRHQQLSALYEMIKQTDRPCLVAGDFNMLWGETEIDMFLAATGLQNANVAGLPTYPSKNPHRHLDFVLHSKGIKVRNFQIPQVLFSDHLPVLVDFDVEVQEEDRKLPRRPYCSCVEKDDLLFANARAQHATNEP